MPSRSLDHWQNSLKTISLCPKFSRFQPGFIERFAFLKTVRTDIKYRVLGTSTTAICLSNDHSLRFTHIHLENSSCHTLSFCQNFVKYLFKNMALKESLTWSPTECQRRSKMWLIGLGNIQTPSSSNVHVSQSDNREDYRSCAWTVYSIECRYFLTHCILTKQSNMWTLTGWFYFRGLSKNNKFVGLKIRGHSGNRSDSTRKPRKLVPQEI